MNLTGGILPLYESSLTMEAVPEGNRLFCIFFEAGSFSRFASFSRFLSLLSVMCWYVVNPFFQSQA